MDLEENAEGSLDREEDKRMYKLTEGDRTLEREYDIGTESGKTEDDVFWTRDASKWSGKGDDAGMWRGKTKEETTTKEMDGGDTRDNEDEPPGAERGDERSEHIERFDYDGR